MIEGEGKNYHGHKDLEVKKRSGIVRGVVAVLDHLPNRDWGPSRCSPQPARKKNVKHEGEDAHQPDIEGEQMEEEGLGYENATATAAARQDEMKGRANDCESYEDQLEHE